MPDREHERGEDQVLQLVGDRPVADGVASGGRKPAQIHREEQLQDQREPEDRHRDPQERGRRGGEVEEAVLTDRAVHAERQRDHGREHERHGHELERRGQPLADHVPDRPARCEADPEVSAQHRRHPAHVLNGHRLVEPEPLPKRIDDRRIDEEPVLEKDRFRASGRRLDDQENEQRDAEEQRDHLYEASADIAAHATSPCGGIARNRATPP